MRKLLLTSALVAAIGSTVVAQSTLYVGLGNSKGYVVGAKLQESGLFRYVQDTTWAHMGWNHPFVSGIAYGKTTGTWHLATGNGEFRSADGGKTWKITTGWRVTEAQHIAIDHFDEHLIYLATSYGIWHSVDDGMTWYESSEGMKEHYTQAIVTDRKTPRRALAATEGGVYVTSDASAHWALVGPVAPMIDIAQSAANPDRWITGSRAGSAYLSKDGGVTWNLSKDADSEVTGVAADPTSADRFAFVTYGSGAFLTEDAGQSWRQIGDGLPTPYLDELVFDPNAPGRLWIGTKEAGIFHSDDSGATWTYAGMNGTMVYDMVFVDQ
ncbi:MAG: hypothetical protein WBW88_07955 [Rhodothermales bacterium]